MASKKSTPRTIHDLVCRDSLCRIDAKRHNPTAIPVSITIIGWKPTVWTRNQDRIVAGIITTARMSRTPFTSFSRTWSTVCVGSVVSSVPILTAILLARVARPELSYTDEKRTRKITRKEPFYGYYFEQMEISRNA